MTIIYLTVSFFTFYLLFVYYLAVMNLKRAHDIKPLTGFTRVAALSVLYPGLFLDAFVNIFVLTFVLLELPKEVLVTARLSRLVKESHGWRGKFSKLICSKLLDQFDPSGCHCK